MFEVGIVGHFEAAHRLRGDFGQATRVHGHTYRVEAMVRGPRLREDGTLCDIAGLEGSLRETIEPMHYRDLDDLSAFEGKNTTAEVVARYVFERMAVGLRGSGLAGLIVRVWESPTAFAGYEGDLA